MPPTPKSPTRMVEPSKLAQQIEFLHDTIDADELRLVTKGRTFELSESIIAGEVHRTIEGASTLKLTVSDYYGKIRNSGMLGAEVDIKLDGLWFRLVAVSKSGNDLELTFESREVAILRLFKKRRVAGWGQLSRTRFVQVLMNEAPATRQIPFICPEMTKAPKKKKTEDEKVIDREYGFVPRKSMYSHGVLAAEGTTTGGATTTPGSTAGLKVKTAVANANQIANIGAVIQEGIDQISVVNKHRRKILVCAIMTITQESTCNNLPFGDGTSVGLFQLIDIHGTVEQRTNIKFVCEWFYQRAIKADQKNPNLSYNDLCQEVQRSGHPHAYAQWRSQAEKWVTAYGVAGWDYEADTEVAEFNLMNEWEQDAVEFQFARGSAKTLPGGRKGWKDESTWDCMNRLADEVNWRCFEVSGMVYFISEPKLFKSAPRARISEQSPGVDWIDFNYDAGKLNGQVTVIGRAGQWAAPPGTTIEIFDNGPVNGRWIVTDITRGIFDPNVNIICKKPRIKLPEPTQAQDEGGLWDNIWTGESPETNTSSRQPSHTPTQKGYPTGQQLRDAVLNNPRIQFVPDSKRMDIQMNVIDERVLVFLLGFTDAGFTAKITSLKTGHSKMTTDNNPSAHGFGRAVDIGNFSTGNLGQTRTAMMWIKDYQVQFGWSQLIGPVEELVIPLGHYPRHTLDEHKDHIHVGWATS